jgi:elongation factor Ts
MKEQITSEMIRDLRERTGVGMSKCKEALVESDGNMEKAVEYLRKAGEATAVKKEAREAKEGILGFAETDSHIAIVEVSAETDFVIKNDQFQNFVHSLCEVAVQQKPDSVDSFLSMGSNVDPIMTIDQMRQSYVQKFGENIQIKKVEIIAKEHNCSYGIYTHLGSKLITMIQLKGSSHEKAFARDIAMHVAAEDPDYLKAEEVPADIKQREGEIAKAQVKNKPENIVEKIVQGKIKAFCDQVCLLSQNYIKDTSKTVQQVVDETAKRIEKPLEVVKFWRWKVGK